MNPPEVKLDRSTVEFEIPAPHYRTRGGSSHRSAKFKVTAEFYHEDPKRPASEPLVMITSLHWQNENDAVVLRLTGSASPQMLYDLADHLPDIAARLERQQAAIAQLTL